MRRPEYELIAEANTHVRATAMALTALREELTPGSLKPHLETQGWLTAKMYAIAREEGYTDLEHVERVVQYTLHGNGRARMAMEVILAEVLADLKKFTDVERLREMKLKQDERREDAVDAIERAKYELDKSISMLLQKFPMRKVAQPKSVKEPSGSVITECTDKPTDTPAGESKLGGYETVPHEVTDAIAEALARVPDFLPLTSQVRAMEARGRMERQAMLLKEMKRQASVEPEAGAGTSTQFDLDCLRAKGEAKIVPIDAAALTPEAINKVAPPDLISCPKYRDKWEYETPEALPPAEFIDMTLVIGAAGKGEFKPEQVVDMPDKFKLEFVNVPCHDTTVAVEVLSLEALNERAAQLSATTEKTIEDAKQTATKFADVLRAAPQDWLDSATRQPSSEFSEDVQDEATLHARIALAVNNMDLAKLVVSGSSSTVPVPEDSAMREAKATYGLGNSNPHLEMDLPSADGDGVDTPVIVKK